MIIMTVCMHTCTWLGPGLTASVPSV